MSTLQFHCHLHRPNSSSWGHIMVRSTSLHRPDNSRWGHIMVRSSHPDPSISILTRNMSSGCTDLPPVFTTSLCLADAQRHSKSYILDVLLVSQHIRVIGRNPNSKLTQFHDAREVSEPDSSAESVFLLPALPFIIGLAVHWVGGSGGPASPHRPRERLSTPTTEACRLIGRPCAA